MAAAFAALSIQAQTFQNLNFEQANPVIVPPPATFYPYDVTAASALPFWIAYLGTVQQTEVLQNAMTYSQASVDIFGPNYPAASSPPEVLAPGTIVGNYSVLLQAGNEPDSPTDVSASIAQTGVIPLGTQSLEFDAWVPPSTGFSVSFDGNNLSPVAIGTGPNYTVYGVNISSYANGQPATLEFSALYTGLGLSMLGLDDITFVTPEPSIVALTAIGGLLFGARKWLRSGDKSH